MRACILAAGEGTRMWPLTEGRPKSLLPVVDKTILEHQILNLKKVGISQIFILVGHRSSMIVESLGNGGKLGVKIEYLHQELRLGTAHAIGIFSNTFDDDFVCLNGDILVDVAGLRELLKIHKKNPKNVIMMLKEIPDPTGYGVVEIKGERVVKIHEKPITPITNLINSGVYIFTPLIFDYIKKTPLSPRGEYEITDSLQMLADKGELYTSIIKGYWKDIATPWDLLSVNEEKIKDFKGKIMGDVEEGVRILGEVYIGKGVRIRSGTYIEGPVYIGDGCDIGPNSYIRGGTVLVKDVRIGAASEVKNSLIMEGSKLPHHNYVGDSVIGAGCNLGSGTKVANLRHDERNITVILKGRRWDTSRRKFGVVLGDNVKTGINTSLNVGTILGSNCITAPGASVSGTYGSGSRIL